MFFKQPEYRHGTRRTEESFTHNIEESKNQGNFLYGLLLVLCVLGLSQIGVIKDANVAKREILVEQRERELQTQPQYQYNYGR